MNDDHEHDENGDCIPPEGGWVVVPPPAWRFSLWDVAGITLHTGAGILNALAQGLALLGQECAASANRSRNTFDLRQAQRAQREAQQAIGADLARIIGIDTPREES